MMNRMAQERCRILFVTSFDVRLVDSVNTDGSMIRLLQDFLRIYEDMCDIFLFTGDTRKFELAPTIKHVPSAFFQRFGLWHLSYAVLSYIQSCPAIEGQLSCKGLLCRLSRSDFGSKNQKKAFNGVL